MTTNLKADDIEDIIDRLMFIAASIPEPWATHCHSAACRLKDMAAAGDRLTALLDLVLTGEFYVSEEIVAALTAWDQA